jgi:hypothetical protein
MTTGAGMWTGVGIVWAGGDGEEKCGKLAPLTGRWLWQFSYWCSGQRGPGGPRYSRPGGRRYWFLRRSSTSAKQERHSIPQERHSMPIGKMLWLAIEGASWLRVGEMEGDLCRGLWEKCRAGPEWPNLEL